MPKGKRNGTQNVQELPAAPNLELAPTPDVQVAQAELPHQAPTEQEISSSGQSDSAPQSEHDGNTGVTEQSEVLVSSHELADTILSALDPALVAEVETMIEEFHEWAKSSEPVDDLSSFVTRRLLNEDHSLTDLGCMSLDSAGIPYRTINFLTLGIPVTYLVSGQKFTVQAGSTLRVLHGGRDRDGLAFYVCDGGERLPDAQIYAHSQHRFYDARYPALQPLGSKYEVGS